LLGIVLLLFLYLTISYQIPALKRRIIFFALLFFADIYLWDRVVVTFHLFSREKERKKRKRFGSIIFTVLYWLPLATVVCTMIVLNCKGVTSFAGTQYYNVVGVCVMLYLMKAVGAVILLMYNSIAFIMLCFKTNKEKFGKKLVKGRKIVLKVDLIIFLLGIALLMYGMIHGAYAFQVKEVNIKTEHPVFQRNSLKVVQISDLHLGAWTDPTEVEKIVDLINEQSPDILFFTGDLVQSSSSEMFKYMDILGKLEAKKGIYSVLGNHDYARYTYYDTQEKREADVKQLIDLQKKLGWKLLLNEFIKLPLDNQNDSIVIAGIEYWSPKKMFFNVGNIKETFRGIEQDDYVIFLSHDPHIWNEVKKQKLPADITLSGHTHGFQMGLDKGKIHFSPVSILYKEWGGVYVNEQNRTQYLYVNVGLGSVGLPARVGIYPEITVLNFSY
ncbi:MAG: metallophosphoesterase, partial [Bacteroidales bacterium]